MGLGYEGVGVKGKEWKQGEWKGTKHEGLGLSGWKEVGGYVEVSGVEGEGFVGNPRTSPLGGEQGPPPGRG